MKKYNIEKELVKLEKTTNWEVVSYLEDLLCGSIQDAIDTLQTYNTEEYCIINEWYDSGDYYNPHSYYRPCLKKLILESDKDFEKRKKDFTLVMEHHNKSIEDKKADKEANELKELERLTKKYGKKLK